MKFVRIAFIEPLEISRVREICTRFGFVWKDHHTNAHLIEPEAEYYLDSDWSVGGSGLWEDEVYAIESFLNTALYNVLYFDIHKSGTITQRFADCVNTLMNAFNGYYVSDGQGLGNLQLLTWYVAPWE